MIGGRWEGEAKLMVHLHNKVNIQDICLTNLYSENMPGQRIHKIYSLRCIFLFRMFFQIAIVRLMTFMYLFSFFFTKKNIYHAKNAKALFSLKGSKNHYRKYMLWTMIGKTLYKSMPLLYIHSKKWGDGMHLHGHF